MTIRTDFEDGLPRCAWVDSSTLYRDYHDHEWGQPVVDDRALFEQLCLEGFQSGLSWRTILNKREAFRRAFSGFDVACIACYDDARIAALLADAGIVRHHGKIQAVVNNARRALELQQRAGTLAAFFWGYEPQATRFGSQPVSTTAESVALSKALKKLGWSFVGPTTVYAFMQSVGMVNDHSPQCHYHAASAAARARFVRPV